MRRLTVQQAHAPRSGAADSPRPSLFLTPGTVADQHKGEGKEERGGKRREGRGKRRGREERKREQGGGQQAQGTAAEKAGKQGGGEEGRAARTVADTPGLVALPTAVALPVCVRPTRLCHLERGRQRWVRRTQHTRRSFDNDRDNTEDTRRRQRRQRGQREASRRRALRQDT